MSVKRLMGRGLADLSDARRFPYRFIDAPGMVQIETRGGIRTPPGGATEQSRTLRLCPSLASGGAWRPPSAVAQAPSRHDFPHFVNSGKSRKVS